MNLPPVYTFGYTGRALQGLTCRLHELGAILVDIRYSPRSRNPDWRREDLAVRYKGRYRWVQALGNRNFRAGPIAIDDLAAGLRELAAVRQPMILLCACMDYATCHRAVVAEALRESGYPVCELDDVPAATPGAMKAISLLQPWSSLVSLGVKTCETRSWPTSYRGPLAVHASKRWHREDVELAQIHPEFLAVWREHGIRRLSELPLGAIVATCRLADVRRTEDVVGTISTQERAFGNFSPGRYAWLLADVVPLPEPVPTRGSLGLWEWSPPEEVR